jgi:protein-S-isoprenylcysteine O-methyltransferase Ste14
MKSINFRRYEMNIVESAFVIVLFLIYLFLWKIKEISMKRKSGIDPNVFAGSVSSLQKYMKCFMSILMAYAFIIIILHSSGIQYASFFTRYAPINKTIFDLIGFATGLVGLSFCLYAQIKMGSSWRVGIDERVTSELIMTGLYRLIRNPTYLGLFLLNVGVWFIWPTWTVFILNLLFIIFLEIQVRCEEDYLNSIHGDIYDSYKKKTKRYFPFIY